MSVTITLGNATALKTQTPFNAPQCARQMRCADTDTDGSRQDAPRPTATAGKPRPGPAPRHCIPANVSAGWAGYPQNVGGDCGWAAVQSRNGGWANATVAIKGMQLVLEVPTALVKGDIVATSYGWGVYAMISTYTAAEVAGGGGGIPVLPWNKTL